MFWDGSEGPNFKSIEIFENQTDNQIYLYALYRHKIQQWDISNIYAPTQLAFLSFPGSVASGIEYNEPYTEAVVYGTSS